MTVRIMRFTKLLLGLGLAACAWPLSGQNARQEIYADPDKAGGVYYAYTYDNPARTPAPEGYEPFYISHYGRHGSRWLLCVEGMSVEAIAAMEGVTHQNVSKSIIKARKNFKKILVIRENRVRNRLQKREG